MKIPCSGCGKRYDSQVDDFCPHCGAYAPSAGAEFSAHPEPPAQESVAAMPAPSTAPPSPGPGPAPPRRPASPLRIDERLRGRQRKNAILSAIVIVLLILMMGIPAYYILRGESREETRGMAAFSLTTHQRS